jgi:hypothetical protein
VKTEVSIQSIRGVHEAQVIRTGPGLVEKRIGDATGARFNSIIAIQGFARSSGAAPRK